jgi:hypothetical protein
VPTYEGQYSTDGKTSDVVGFSLRVGRNGRSSIPVRAVFYPYAPFTDAAGRSTSSDLASFARVALAPVEADPNVGNPLNDDGPAPGVPSQGFRVVLQNGTYRRSLEPVPPFDEHFPPIVDQFTAPTDVSVEIAKDVPLTTWHDPKQFTLDSLQPLDGWQLYFRDLQYHLRVSSIFKPRTGHNEVTLFTAGYSDLAQPDQRVEIVIAPPPNQPFLPTYESEVVVSPGPQQMPLIPPAKHFAGVVRGRVDALESEAWPFVRATVRFKSAVGNQDESLLEPTDKDSRLHYTTEVTTDENGSFAVTLPPGAYDVLVLPAFNSGFGTKVFPRRQFGSTSLGFGTSFTSPPLGKLQGTVTLPNKAPLAGATVRANPSFNRSPDLGPFGVVARSRATLTGSDGSFSLAVDAGTYDIIVEPPPSSHWPTTIILGEKVPEEVDVAAGTGPRTVVEPVRVAPIELRAPIDLGFTLAEPSGTRPVVGALVRAYALVDGNVPIELGHALSDANGRINLYVTMPAKAH